MESEAVMGAHTADFWKDSEYGAYHPFLLFTDVSAASAVAKVDQQTIELETIMSMRVETSHGLVEY